MWLERFADVSLIRKLGGLHVYACRDATTAERRVVLLGGPGAEPSRVRATLDAMAATHAALDHPGIPRVPARDRIGDIEYLAFASDAVVDLLTLNQRLQQRPRGTLTYPQLAALMLVGGEPMIHAHATRDPFDGLPICLGRISFANFLVAEDGRIQVFGFGRSLADDPWSSVEGGEVFAPEVSGGGRPMPWSDLFASGILFSPLIGGMTDLPALQRNDPELAALVARTSSAALSTIPSLRTPSIEAFLATQRRVWELGEVTPDREGLARLLAELLREVLSRDAPTADLAGARADAAAAALICLRGRYQLTAALGKGGMGTAYRAWDRQLRQDVVVKRLHDTADQSRHERFVREVRLLRQVAHPHLLRGYDLVEEDGTLYAVTELIEGERLDVHVAAAGEAEAIARGAEIADGLASLHAMGVVHRDVKPSNIIVHPTRGAVLIDFGIAHEADSDLTRTGVAMGTPQFMSPEQARGGATGPHSDVYSLARVLQQVVPRPSAALAAVLEPCLRAEPEARSTAADLALALRAVRESAA